MKRDERVDAFRAKTIWIDLDNSPHVPFFKPIIEKLQEQGHELILTARGCYQVRELAEFHGLRCQVMGRHYGRSKILKVLGLLLRAMQLMPTAWRHRPDLALSHGSRAQTLVAAILGIPSAWMDDYEYGKMLPFIHPTWLVVPEVVSRHFPAKRIRAICKYPGIKEDIYVPSFKPDGGILECLGIQNDDLVITIRPPATEAHYHNTHSEALFEASLDFLCQNQSTRVVLLPRNEKQAVWIKQKWQKWCAQRKIVLPDHVVNGLNLIWHSDLVISGGGTIIREAAALGVPAYSIFRGTIGAIDRHLVHMGRLVLLSSVTDVRSKIVLARRRRPAKPDHANPAALRHIVGGVEAMLNECA